MASTLFAVVDKPADAQYIIDELTQSCLCDRSDIGLMTRNAGGTVGGGSSGSSAASIVNDMSESAQSVLEGMFKAANAMSRALPGGGLLRSAGNLAQPLLQAGLGTATELAKALVGAGAPPNDARDLGQAFEQGGVLISISCKTDQMERCARKVLSKYGATPRPDLGGRPSAGVRAFVKALDPIPPGDLPHTVPPQRPPMPGHEPIEDPPTPEQPPAIPPEEPPPGPTA
jgi:hypothetical protein